MKRFSIKALSVAVPVLTGAVILAPTAAYADGPSESASVTSVHKNGVGQNISCTLKFTIITDYQGVPTANRASFDITNVGDCRDATFQQRLTWRTPNGGFAEVDEGFGGTPLVPAHSEDVYRPVNAAPGNAVFTETTNFFQFDNCIANCTLSLSLTADGVK